MEQSYAARLRYLDANDVDDSVVDFDGLDVQGRNDEDLGDVDGFIVDPDNGRVCYVVVDSGGWFTSRRFLVPIGHAVVDRERGVLRVDVNRESLQHFPPFEEAGFQSLSDDELRAYEQRVATVMWPDERGTEAGVGPAYYETSPHYTQPEWWRGGTWSRERLRPIDARSDGGMTRRAAADSTAGLGSAERVMPATVQTRTSTEDRELITAREHEESPHYAGRAQPGDVLGLETGGETTGIGDTSEDENRRREAVEKSLRDRS